MERAFKAQNLARHEPECLIGCAAYEYCDMYSFATQNELVKLRKPYLVLRCIHCGGGGSGPYFISHRVHTEIQ